MLRFINIYLPWNTVYDIYKIVFVLQYLEPFVQIGLKGTNHCDNHYPLHWRSASIPQRKFELELFVCASHCYVYEKWRHASKKGAFAIVYCLFSSLHIVRHYTLRIAMYPSLFFCMYCKSWKMIWRVLIDSFEEGNATWSVVLKKLQILWKIREIP